MRGRDRPCPAIVELIGHRPEQHAIAGAPRVGQGRQPYQVRGGEAVLAPTARPFDVLEDRAVREPCEHDLGACLAKQLQLLRARRIVVDPDQRANVESKASQGEGGVRGGAAEAPAARVPGGDIARSSADHEDTRSRGVGRASGAHRRATRSPDVSCGTIPN
jgi:hypothetical protein